MKLVSEKGPQGQGLDLIGEWDVPMVSFERDHLRKPRPRLPHMSENEISRHYTELTKRSHGINDGFYPLGFCTMKYNPKVNEQAAALKGFQRVHPLWPQDTVQGSMEVLYLVEKYLCETTGMDAMIFQPAASAHGGFIGLLLIKAYHVHRNGIKRIEITVSDSVHGTNPTNASMCGYDVVGIPSRKDGCVDLKQLRTAVGEDTAGLMLTNPNTAGLFDKNILDIARVVHEAGGLCYYDGANLNAVMGIVCPGDMGLGVAHLNLYKTFSTPYGGGGPGSGPVGCKLFLEPYLPDVRAVRCEDKGRGRYVFRQGEESIGDVKMFYGNSLVVVKTLAYIITFDREGVPETSSDAALNANYMKVRLSDAYDMAYDETRMHEFVTSLENMKHENGATAMDIAKASLDYGIHPSTMYFPLIVHEALTVEPTETGSRETLDETIEVPHRIYQDALSAPEELHSVSRTTPIERPDEATAACRPVLRYTWESEWTWGELSARIVEYVVRTGFSFHRNVLL